MQITNDYGMTAFRSASSIDRKTYDSRQWSHFLELTVSRCTFSDTRLGGLHKPREMPAFVCRREVSVSAKTGPFAGMKWSDGATKYKPWLGSSPGCENLMLARKIRWHSGTLPRVQEPRLSTSVNANQYSRKGVCFRQRLL